MDIDLEVLASRIDLLEAADLSAFCCEPGETRLLVRRGDLGTAEATFADQLRATTPAASLRPEPCPGGVSGH